MHGRKRRRLFAWKIITPAKKGLGRRGSLWHELNSFLGRHLKEKKNFQFPPLFHAACLVIPLSCLVHLTCPSHHLPLFCRTGAWLTGAGLGWDLPHACREEGEETSTQNSSLFVGGTGFPGGQVWKDLSHWQHALFLFAIDMCVFFCATTYAIVCDTIAARFACLCAALPFMHSLISRLFSLSFLSPSSFSPSSCNHTVPSTATYLAGRTLLSLLQRLNPATSAHHTPPAFLFQACL